VTVRPPGKDVLISKGDVRTDDSQDLRRIIIALDLAGSVLRITQEESRFASNLSARLLSLDTTFDEIAPGSWVVIDRPDAEAPIVARVGQVRTISRADYGISAQVTLLQLDRPWLVAGRDVSLSVVRGTTVYAQSERLRLTGEPIEEDVAGDTVELDGLYDGLEAGRWIVVSGERTDVLDESGTPVEDVEASELVMLAGVEHDVGRMLDANGNEVELPTDTLHTQLILAEPLAYRYKRETVTINANVAKATHGETRGETLGSGDAATPFQQFALAASPLTYLAAPTPDGAQSTLEVRVDAVRWHEQKTLLALEGGKRGFITKTDDDGVTTAVFGDGSRGARLPTGMENVTAVYRFGIGKSGNVAAKQISSLATRPLGVKEVSNPEAAAGGADPESRDQARRNAPLAVLALDRLVSVEDYGNFARTFAGIAKASAASLSDGWREIVHLTVAGLDDAPIDRRTDLYRNLRLALHRFGDPNQPVQVVAREAVFILLSAQVKVLDDYLWDDVAPKIRAALLEQLSFDRHELGETVRLSTVIATIQSIAGIDYVDVDLFDGISETEASDPEILAQKLEALAGAATRASQPRQSLAVELARVEASEAAGLHVRPAQIAYLNPDLPDTLILTEVV
jgi:predicted phage baseplate assembly protein